MWRRLSLLGLIVISAALPAPAAADTTQSVKAQLLALQLSPPMLFPTRLPSRLVNADASLDTSSFLTVSWDRGAVNGGNRIGSIGLTRADRRQLQRDLATARSRGYTPRRVTVGKRRVWRLCGHVCGYEWIEQNRSYGVFGIYYIGDETGQTVAADQRQIIRSLAPLR